MKSSNMADSHGGLPYAENQGDGISAVRQQVISGNWTAINNGDFTLAGLGLRHNGSGLVWLHSGVSVWEADADTCFTGLDKASHGYHSALCPAHPANGAEFSRGVHAHKVDSYSLMILCRSASWVEYWNRNDGKALSTFAVQVLMNERQGAFDGWFIYRHPEQADKYTVIHEERDRTLIKEYIRRGWTCESAYELSLLVKSNIEFGRLMARLGYVSVRTAKITGRQDTFWVYRSVEKGLRAAQKQPVIDAGYLAAVRRVSRGKDALCKSNALKKKDNLITVQASEKPQKAFKLVAVDGRWLYIYDDHIRYLRKIRTRIDGKQAQGYTAKDIHMEVVG